MAFFPPETDELPPLNPTPTLIRTLGLGYYYNNERSTLDPLDRFFNDKLAERSARMQAIIEQHPDSRLAEMYLKMIAEAELQEEKSKTPGP